jgi:two-component system, NtrC family, sensor histidine kinase HydH
VKTETELAQLGRLLDLDEAAFADLKRIGEFLEPHMEEIAEGFYVRLEQHPEAVAVFRGGTAQIARQRDALVAWLRDALTTVRNDAFVARGRRIGFVHLSAGVDEFLMMAGAQWLRDSITDVFLARGTPTGLSRSECEKRIQALITFDTTVVLQAYGEELRDRVSRLDRLALVGRFAATISHELKNPLGVIGTSLHLLRRQIAAEDTAKAKVAKQLDKLDRSHARAQAIVVNLLDMVRLKDPNRQRVDVGHFVDEALEDLEHPAAIETRVRAPEGEVRTGLFDPEQLRLVIDNLLRNAVEALEDRGLIEVRWEAGAFSTTIRVADDGPGIPESERPRIFEPLHSGKAFGTGLGLTLARSIVDAHGGEIGVHAGIGGAGVAFEIRIPHFAGPATRRSD